MKIEMASNLRERPRKNESPERFIKRFIKKCKKMGIIQEVRDRKQFVSKSERKRHLLSQNERKRRKKVQNGKNEISPSYTLL